MDLFIIEAKGKTQLLSRILSAKYSDFQVFATFGQLFDTPTNRLGIHFPSLTEDKTPRRPDVINRLGELIYSSDHIYIMTDYDEVGEQIARDVVEYFNLNNYSRIRISSFTEKEIFSKLESQHGSKVDYNIATTSDAKRIINKIVGYSIIDEENGFEKSLPIGTISTPLLYHLNNANNIVSELHAYNSYRGIPFKMVASIPRLSIDKEKEVREILKNIIDRTFLNEEYLEEMRKEPVSPLSYLNYYDLLSKIDGEILDTQEKCQSSYEKGKISYFRTNSRKRPNKSLDHLKEKYGKLDVVEEFDIDDLEEIKEDQGFLEPHESITPENNSINIFDNLHSISYDNEIPYYIEKYFLLIKSNSKFERIKIQAKIKKEEMERLKQLNIVIEDSFNAIEVRNNKSSFFKKYYDELLSPFDFLSKQNIKEIRKREYSKEKYVLKELYATGISKPSTIVNHSMKIASFINSDYSINKKARISLNIVSKKAPKLLHVEKIKDMISVLESESGLVEKVRGGLEVLGMNTDMLNISVKEDFKPEILNEKMDTNKKGGLGYDS